MNNIKRFFIGLVVIALLITGSVTVVKNYTDKNIKTATVKVNNVRYSDVDNTYLAFADTVGETGEENKWILEVGNGVMDNNKLQELKNKYIGEELNVKHDTMGTVEPEDDEIISFEIVDNNMETAIATVSEVNWDELANVFVITAIDDNDGEEWTIEKEVSSAELEELKGKYLNNKLMIDYDNNDTQYESYDDEVVDYKVVE